MTKAEANKLVVQRFLEALEAGDLETLEALQSPNANWWQYRSGNMSLGEYLIGAENLISSTQSRKAKIVSMIAEDDRVAVEILVEFDFGDKVYKNAFHDVFIFEGGLIHEVREYMDAQVTQDGSR